MKYPATIRPVKAAEICRGPYRHPTKPGCGCAAFNMHRRLLPAGDDAVLACDDIMGRITKCNTWWFDWNLRTPAATQARVINKAFRLLGYRRKGKLLVWAGSRKAKGK